MFPPTLTITKDHFAGNFSIYKDKIRTHMTPDTTLNSRVDMKVILHFDRKISSKDQDHFPRSPDVIKITK